MKFGVLLNWTFPSLAIELLSFHKAHMLLVSSLFFPFSFIILRVKGADNLQISWDWLSQQPLSLIFFGSFILGSLKGNGIFDTQSFTGSCGVPLPPFSLGKAFGPLRFPRECHSFGGQQHWKRLLLWIISQRGVCHLVNRHCMCQGIGESMDHLLIHCNVANALWGDVFRNLGFTGLC